MQQGPKQRELFFVLLLAIAPQWGIAQNLIPNPSFETLDECPTFQAQLDRAPPWLPAYFTPDLFHTCIVGDCGTDPIPCVPSSLWTYQYPRTGDGFSGNWVGDAGSFTREFMRVELPDTLEPEVRYQLTFYVSLGDIFNLAVAEIGAYFSSAPTSGDPVGLEPQVTSPPGLFLTDRVNWIQVRGTFCATGNEKHMTVGLFTPYATTEYLPVPTGGTANGTYYLFDDFELVAVGGCDQAVVQACRVEMPTVFTPNNDGSNDRLVPVLRDAVSAMTTSIYSPWGSLLFETADPEIRWRGDKDHHDVPEGVYFWVTKSTCLDGQQTSDHGVVTLLR